MAIKVTVDELLDKDLQFRQSKNASMNNTLIDNSENLKMADTLKKCISNDNCKVIKIATGYWDIPGIMLVEEELHQFLEKDGRELQLLIGTDQSVQLDVPENRS